MGALPIPNALAENTAPPAPSIDEDLVSSLARSLGLRSLTTRLLVGRGIRDEARARRFLAPRLADLRPPDGGASGPAHAMAGFARAAARLVAALECGETVGVFGDYDVDGLTTCALLTRFLLDAGGRAVARVARRDAGYGFSPADARAFADAGCTLVVTGDCGTSDFESLALAKELGLDVIVVDHHQVPERDPGAFALLNPHQPGCGFPFKGLASVGVAFYLAAAVRTVLKSRPPAPGRPEPPDPRPLLDLAAVGTIADLAPLTDENRVLVAAGLRELARAGRPGLRALAELAGIDFSRGATTTHVSFKLAPRLNAPGRLGHAEQALELLLAPDPLAALDAAKLCEESNTLRRALQDQVYAEAVAIAEAELARGQRAALVVAGDGWPHGVVGIVAAKLVDRYRLPAVAIALDGASGRGSARTPPGLHLYRALAACGSLLERFGGHAAAAGLTIARDRLDEFREAFDAAARGQRGAEPASAALADAEVDLDDIDERLADELALLAPFGAGNPEPLFATTAWVERSRAVGEGHLQLTLRGALFARDAIAFRQAPLDPGAGARIRVLFTPEIDWYRGEKRLRLRVHSFAPEA